MSVAAIRKEETKANKPTTSSFDNLDRSSFDPSASVYHIFNNHRSKSYISESELMTIAIFLSYIYCIDLRYQGKSNSEKGRNSVSTIQHNTTDAEANENIEDSQGKMN